MGILDFLCQHFATKAFPVLAGVLLSYIRGLKNTCSRLREAADARHGLHVRVRHTGTRAHRWKIAEYIQQRPIT